VLGLLSLGKYRLSGRVLGDMWAELYG
jgi:hypothetical protein